MLPKIYTSRAEATLLCAVVHSRKLESVGGRASVSKRIFERDMAAARRVYTLIFLVFVLSELFFHSSLSFFDIVSSFSYLEVLFYSTNFST